MTIPDPRLTEQLQRRRHQSQPPAQRGLTRAPDTAVPTPVLAAAHGHLCVPTTALRPPVARQRPCPRPPRRGPQQGPRAASHRRRRGSGVPGGVDLGPFVSLSGFWSCAPITRLPPAPRGLSDRSSPQSDRISNLEPVLGRDLAPPPPPGTSRADASQARGCARPGAGPPRHP